MTRETLVHLSKHTLKHMGSNGIGSVMSVTALTLCLFFVGGLSMLIINARQLAPAWIEDDKAVAYLQPKASSKEAEGLAQEIRKWQEVKQVVVVSKEEARKALEQQLGDWKSVLRGISENPLPASLEITLQGSSSSAGAADALIGKLRQFPQVEEVLCGKSWVERLEFWGSLNALGTGAIGLFAITALLILFNTTRLSVYTRQNEIEIYGIVGATPMFARAPFYLEGIFYGAASGFLAVGLLAFFASTFRKVLPQPMAAALQWSGPGMLLLSAGVLAGSVALAWLGAWLALKGPLRSDSWRM